MGVARKISIERRRTKYLNTLVRPYDAILPFRSLSRRQALHTPIYPLQFTMVETVTTALFDQFESLRSKKPLVVGGTCFLLFLLGLTMCLEGGVYMFELFFFFSSGTSVIILAFFEVVAIQYVYGECGRAMWGRRRVGNRGEEGGGKKKEGRERERWRSWDGLMDG